MKKEIWKPIKGYEGLYEVSNFGRVMKSPQKHTVKYREGIILKLSITHRGYARVQLSKGGKPKKFYVHRLVAETFIPNPKNKAQVNHIDENKVNNCVENLEWVTQTENHNHGTINQRISAKRRNDVNLSMPVEQYSKSGELLCSFPSIREAERKTKIFNGSISLCCRKKLKTAGGYVWKYAERVAS